MDSRDDNPPDNSGDLVLDLDERVPAMVTVRRWAADALADLSDEVLGDVLLVVTELVTNAYDHGLFAREVRLLRISEPCSVRIEVDDSSPEQPVLGRSRIDRHRGRGLVIVDRLSKEWGVIPNVVGKTVWAEVSCGSC
ncbi:anti-sigma regulatory factor (Ser/Thr protein kinase) [Lentzea atacamensis]|uniref:Anti-sigma regulatory factor (Ser/Thr protein kinase) n=1 Tax=Lentzea atacamensis TaxID=531938 RepID=A0ABX9E847_9PSEU|nr:ATP-binding protein [Lentzea atacamensis]RAS65870.1 anti-sigma regulatory factor (Ser/Thr protein kinase) [Lentzea atacamensis]